LERLGVADDESFFNCGDYQKVSKVTDQCFNVVKCREVIHCPSDWLAFFIKLTVVTRRVSDSKTVFFHHADRHLTPTLRVGTVV
jgi:hypothetical protein